MSETQRERSPRERVREIVDAQASDASLDDILRELAFHRVILRGLRDADQGRTLSHSAFGDRVRGWLAE